MTYDKFARPSQHYNTTEVAVRLTIRHVDLEEDKSIFSVYGWISMVNSKWKILYSDSVVMALCLFTGMAGWQVEMVTIDFVMSLKHTFILLSDSIYNRTC